MRRTKTDCLAVRRQKTEWFKAAPQQPILDHLTLSTNQNPREPKRKSFQNESPIKEALWLVNHSKTSNNAHVQESRGSDEVLSGKFYKQNTHPSTVLQEALWLVNNSKHNKIQSNQFYILFKQYSMQKHIKIHKINSHKKVNSSSINWTRLWKWALSIAYCIHSLFLFSGGIKWTVTTGLKVTVLFPRSPSPRTASVDRQISDTPPWCDRSLVSISGRSPLVVWIGFSANGTTPDSGTRSDSFHTFSSLGALLLSRRKTESPSLSLHSDSPLPNSMQLSDTPLYWEHLVLPANPFFV